MAGIGFELKKLFAQNPDQSCASSIVKSLIVTSGPWMISVLTMLAIQFTLNPWMDKNSHEQILVILVYGFVFSNVLTAAPTNMIIRYVSDLIFLEKTKEILSVFFGGAILIGFLAFSTSFLFVHFFTELQWMKIEISWFFTSLCLLWLIMVVVGAMRDYNTVVSAYLSGMGSGFLFMYLYGGNDIRLHLIFFTSGVCLILFWLLARFFREFEFDRLLRFDWLKKSYLYPLFFSGLFLGFSQWADKMIYWFFSPHGVEIQKGFFLFPAYDFAIFLANLTLIPTLSYFTIFIETHFYEIHREYMSRVLLGSDLPAIDEAANNLFHAWLLCLFQIFIFHTVISLFFLILLLPILDWLGSGIEAAPILKITSLNVLLQTLFQSMIIFLYYFDYQKEVLFLTGTCFFLTCFIGISFRELPYEFTGFPYFLAMLTSVVLTFLVSVYKLKRLNYYTLASNEVNG